MESPSAQAANSAMLLHHLDSMPPGGGLHRRRVSRTPQVQSEEVFHTPRNVPASPRGTLDPWQSPNRAPLAVSASPWYGQKDAERVGLGGAQTGSRTAEASAAPVSPHRRHHQHHSGSAQAGTPPVPFSTHNSPRGPREGRRRCAACDQEISGHFVRALGAAYHIHCFTCDDCGVECASKFFPMDNRPLCEHCYFKRQNLLCHRCNGSLRGSYITALNHKYHVEHFTCSLCPTVFGPDDSYFEHEGNVYCRSHYAALFAFRCEGCSSPILKQFVETARGGKNLRWHPECYMIYKFWNVKVEDTGAEEVDQLRRKIASDASQPHEGQEYAVPTPVNNDKGARRVQKHEDAVEGLAMQIWTTLCGYEEACGDQISALVQTAVNGDFREAYSHCTKFVAYVDILFRALDILPPIEEPIEVAGSGKEAKTLCRKVVSYMSLLSKTRQLSSRDRVAGLARDLLSLASAMAHYLKVLIRFGLSRALRTQSVANDKANRGGSSRDHSHKLLIKFLESVALYATAKPAKPVSPFSSDRCGTCGKSVEDRCYRQKSRNDRLWHATAECFACSKCHKALDAEATTISDAGHLFCLKCSNTPSQSFVRTTRLEQYVILLHVALARLDLVLSNHKRPQSQQNSQSQKQQPDQTSMSTPTLPGKRSHNESPVSSGATSGADSAPSTLERTSTILNSKRGLTLDDIRRIVATEQAHSAEQKRAKTPQSSNTQQSKQPPPSKRGVDGARPTLSSYPSTSVLPNGKVSPNKDHFFGKLDDEDYLWVQYIAQALIQPIVKDVLQTDLELLESESAVGTSNTSTVAASSIKQSQGGPGGSIWERMGKVFTGVSKSSTGGSSNEPQDGVFGQPLERVVALHGVDSALGVPETGGEYTLRIPSFVDDCVGAMRQKDMSVEGVFRKNGNIRRLREFVERIDKFPDENGLLVDESPIQLAALLKKFLRDLPDPLLTSRLARMWIAVSRLDSEQQARIVPLLISLLPRVNRNVLETLVHFLNWVSGFAQVEDDIGSKMDIANLATVLTPTLILSSEEAASIALIPGQTDGLEDELGNDGSGTNNSPPGGYKHATEVVKLLIQEYTLVAQVPREILFYLRRMKQLKLTPRRLSLRELNELMKQ